MVNLSDFLSQVKAIASERPTYRLGGDGSDGTCDCIGLIIGAIERAGGRWKGTHGSNYAARNEMSVMNRQVDATQLELGWAVYKAKAPGESGYALPNRYKDGTDLLDYYHVGVVTGIEPLEITHCTTGGGVDGITTDNRQGKWLYAGPLKQVERRGGDAIGNSYRACEQRNQCEPSQDSRRCALRPSACGRYGERDRARRRVVKGGVEQQDRLHADPIPGLRRGGR